MDNTLEENVGEHIAKYVTEEKNIAVGVSGGKDSMCLLHYLINCGGVKKDKITVVHINHGIRKNAKLDEEFVERFCAENKLKFNAFMVDIPNLCAATGRSVEHEARNARLGVFSQLLNIGVADMVLTAHHQDDLAESVLMHMFRGCGLKGLIGMEIFNEKSKIFRPFLYVSKQQIGKYVEEHKVEFRDDESNFDDKYDRNFLRLKVLPLIQKRWGGAVENIAALSRRAADEYAAAENMLDYKLIAKDGQDVVLYKTAFDSPFLARYVFKSLELIGMNSDIEQRHIDLIIDLWHKQSNGCKIQLPHSLTVIREYDKVRFSTVENVKFDRELAFDGVGDYALGECVINIELSSLRETKRIIDNKTVGSKTDGNKEYSDKTVASKDSDNKAYGDKAYGDLASVTKIILAADLNKIPVGAVVRFRRDGDVFTPYGGKRKKLKSYFIDEKIPLSKRDKIPCLCYNNEILAIAGYEISDKIKIDDTTISPIKITYGR